MAEESAPAVPTALCHDWLTAFGGAEQVSQRIATALDIRDIYTFAADPSLARALFPEHRIFAHHAGLTSFAREHWRWLLPVMPRAWRQLDLSAYRLVVTSSYACVNAIRPPAGTHHISYCHSPMRYAWDWQLERRRLPRPAQPLWPAAAAVLRRADRTWAAGVTLFVASSRNIRERIRRSYGRESVIVYPPIDTSYWSPEPGVEREDFFLLASRLVAFKRGDIVVDAASSAGVPLVVAGSGPELENLRRRAAPNVRFLSQVPQDRLRELYRKAKALVFPGVDDFGMGMVEAQACGTPVVAYDAGGAQETVENGVTGLLYRDPAPSALARVLKGFDPTRYRTEDLRRHVRTFDVEQFDRSIRRVARATLGVSVSVAATDDFAERLQQDLDVERQ